MRFVCQLKDGYMLAQIGKSSYAPIKTGYPYPDTPNPSQVELDNLVHKLGIKSDPKYTIEYLIDIMSPFMDNDILVSEKSLKELLQTGRMYITDYRKSRISVFFDCSFLTIYYAEDVRETAFFAQIEERLQSVDLEDDNCFILHFHKGIDTLYKPTLISKLEVALGGKFDLCFRRTFGTSADKLSSYYNRLYTQLDKLDLKAGLLSSDTDSEWFSFCSSKPMEFALKMLMSEINGVCCLDEIYTKLDESQGYIEVALREIYGYNVLSGLLHKKPFDDCFSSFFLNLLALYSCVYTINSSASKKSIAKDIDALLKDELRMIGLSLCSAKVDSCEDGNLGLLINPYFYYMYKNNLLNPNSSFLTSVLVRFKARVELLKSGDSCRLVFNEFEDLKAKPFEKRLLYYFLSVKLMEWFNKNFSFYEDGNTVFSYRNVLKTLIPNFDRLFLLGAIDNTENLDYVLALRFSYASLGYIHNNQVPKLVDVALDEMGCFSEEERSFITLVPFLKTITCAQGDAFTFEVHLRNAVEVADEEGYYTPKLKDSFIANIRPVMEMFALVTLLKQSEYGISRLYNDYSREFSYSDDVFYVVLKKRS